MSVKTYTFTNEYGQLKFTASSGGETTPSQIPLELEEFINIFPVSMGDSDTSWTDICNAYRNGARIIGISDDGQYQVSDITTGSNGSITFYRTVNNFESGTVTFYFWVYAASNGVGTWQTEYWITTNFNNAKTTGWWGSSSISATTTPKTVTCSGYTLNRGNIIGILFSYGNTLDSFTLNINSTGSKDVYVGNSIVSSTNKLCWSNNTVLYFLYDGTYYRYLTSIADSTVQQPRGANTWYTTSTTAAATQGKTTAALSNYVLTKGSLVVISFSNANTYTSAKITLDVGSTGAKDIYYNGAITSSTNNLLWDAGETLTFMYDGTYYRFVSKSKSSSPATVTLTQLQTGTDTTGYLISPKVLADYIASLDASNVSY